MVADFAQLHQHIDDLEKVARLQLGLRAPRRHEIIVEAPLTLGQSARHHLLNLVRELRLHVLLQAPEDEGAKNRVEALHQRIVHGRSALHHVHQGVGEPVAELRVRGKNVGHQEVQKRPQLHEVVLQRRAREKDSTLCAEAKKDLPALRLEVLDVVRLVEDHVLPALAAKHLLVLHDHFVRGDADVEGVGLGPPLALQLALLLAAVVRKHLE
mmetsp:Transcript_61333/g.147631  ORF Transcript_61333/g.147631 Transcript_61333/m.147631 type:complete len:212 (+) Transcript_61333:1973-2608(+)